MIEKEVSVTVNGDGTTTFAVAIESIRTIVVERDPDTDTLLVRVDGELWAGQVAIGGRGDQSGPHRRGRRPPVRSLLKDSGLS